MPPLPPGPHRPAPSWALTGIHGPSGPACCISFTHHLGAYQMTTGVHAHGRAHVLLLRGTLIHHSCHRRSGSPPPASSTEHPTPP